MAKNGQRLGELLLEANVVTKRQLAKAIQKQLKGDDRKLGEILIGLGYLTIDDLTEKDIETLFNCVDKIKNNTYIKTFLD